MNSSRASGCCCLLFTAVIGGACQSAVGPTTPGSSSAPAPVIPHIVVLGDSLAVSPSRDQNFPAELQARLDEYRLGARIVNASESGDTTADGLRRLDAALVEGVRVLIVALGANDGIKGVPVTDVERNLAAIITRAQGRNIRVLLCGMEAPPVRGWKYTLEFHFIFPRLATQHGVPLVPFLLEGVAFNPDMNGADRIHPNAAGARRIADTIWPYLEPMVRAELSAVSALRSIHDLAADDRVEDLGRRDLVLRNRQDVLG